MKALVIAKRLIKQIGSDKRSLGLMFIAPVLIIYLLSVIFTSSTSKPKIDVVSAPDTFVQALTKDTITSNVNNEGIALERLKSGLSNAYVVFSNNAPKVTVEGSDPMITKSVTALIKKALMSEIIKLPQASSPQVTIPEPSINYLYASSEIDFFDSMAPLLMGFFIFFFVFLIAGVSFLRERISGTLERILATPLKRYEIVFGYFLGFGVFITIQTIIIQTFMVYGLKVFTNGNFFLILLINLLLAGQSLALGTLLSAFAKNEFQLFQFIPIVIVPQILFSGIFDLSEAPVWVNALSHIFPLTYGAKALKDVMIRGLGLMDIWKELIIIVAFGVVFISLNSLALKKYRKI